MQGLVSHAETTGEEVVLVVFCEILSTCLDTEVLEELATDDEVAEVIETAEEVVEAAEGTGPSLRWS